MARGFLTGLFQGSLMGGAALVALSLVVPQPQQPQQAVPPAAAPVAPAAVPKAAPNPERQAARPQAPVVTVPAGSEFGRAGDRQPDMPAAMQPPKPETDATDAPAQPVAEAAPVQSSLPVTRPDSELPAGVGQGRLVAPPLDPPAPALPAAATGPIPALELPRMGQAASQDAAPDRTRLPLRDVVTGVQTPAAAVPAPALSNPVPPGPAPVAARAGDRAAPTPPDAATSRAPQPGIDLTTPPDFSNLGLPETD